MRKGIIKDPTFSVYKKGGNVEKPMEAKGDGSAKKELMKLAKDEADILFDLENDIVEQLKLDYLKEGGKGQTFMDWLKSKPESYLRNLPKGLARGGVVKDPTFTYYNDGGSVKPPVKDEVPIKEIDLDSEMNKAGAALLKLNKEDRQTVLDLLRRSGVFKD